VVTVVVVFLTVFVGDVAFFVTVVVLVVVLAATGDFFTVVDNVDVRVDGLAGFLAPNVLIAGREAVADVGDLI
jgi:hypothetical protein